MLYLKDIMKLLSCDMEKAEKVFENMALDFSQSTTRQFNAEVKMVNELIEQGVI